MYQIPCIRFLTWLKHSHQCIKAVIMSIIKLPYCFWPHNTAINTNCKWSELCWKRRYKMSSLVGPKLRRAWACWRRRRGLCSRPPTCRPCGLAVAGWNRRRNLDPVYPDSHQLFKPRKFQTLSVNSGLYTEMYVFPVLLKCVNICYLDFLSSVSILHLLLLLIFPLIRRLVFFSHFFKIFFSQRTSANIFALFKIGPPCIPTDVLTDLNYYKGLRHEIRSG